VSEPGVPVIVQSGAVDAVAGAAATARPDAMAATAKALAIRFRNMVARELSGVSDAVFGVVGMRVVCS
jgi:hypothetical protein